MLVGGWIAGLSRELPASPVSSSPAVGLRRSAGGRNCLPRRWRSMQGCGEGRWTGSGTSARDTAECKVVCLLSYAVRRYTLRYGNR